MGQTVTQYIPSWINIGFKVDPKSTVDSVVVVLASNLAPLSHLDFQWMLYEIFSRNIIFKCQ